jgi:hypothetical protein
MDIRDSRGKLLGKIKELSSGKREARNASGRLCGTYDPKNDVTRDASGRLIGKGDQLARLIEN